MIWLCSQKECDEPRRRPPQGWNWRIVGKERFHSFDFIWLSKSSNKERRMFSQKEIDAMAENRRKGMAEMKEDKMKEQRLLLFPRRCESARGGGLF